MAFCHHLCLHSARLVAESPFIVAVIRAIGVIRG